MEAATFCFVDLEMTGLNPKVDRVIELCIERVRGARTDSVVTSLVMPYETAPLDGAAPGEPPAAGGVVMGGVTRVIGNVQVHGIDADALVDAPSFATLASDVEAILAGGIVVAHAAAWDIAFLEAEFTRAGDRCTSSITSTR